jgi:hypothetical protein
VLGLGLTAAVWLFPGMSGYATDIHDAYARFVSNGEKFNTSGLDGRRDPKLVEEFSKIINDYIK